jgi:hypothetical protein
VVACGGIADNDETGRQGNHRVHARAGCPGKGCVGDLDSGSPRRRHSRQDPGVARRCGL